MKKVKQIALCLTLCIVGLFVLIACGTATTTEIATEQTQLTDERTIPSEEQLDLLDAELDLLNQELGLLDDSEELLRNGQFEALRNKKSTPRGWQKSCRGSWQGRENIGTNNSNTVLIKRNACAIQTIRPKANQTLLSGQDFSFTCQVKPAQGKNGYADITFFEKRNQSYRVAGKKGNYRGIYFEGHRKSGIDQNQAVVTYYEEINGKAERVFAATTADENGWYTLTVEGTASDTLKRPYVALYTGSGSTLFDDCSLTIIDSSEPNSAPIAVDDELATEADTVLTFTATELTTNDSDVDGNALSIAAITALVPAKGTLTDNADGSYSYDPNGEFADLLTTETVSFNYTISDGDLTDTGTVTITVTGTKVELTEEPTVTGSGAVTCGSTATCTGSYEIGTVLTLTATPTTGSKFTGWTNCPNTATATTCEITIGATTNLGNISANFEALTCGDNPRDVTGNQTITTQAEINALSDVNKINGDLILNPSSNLDFSPLSLLTEITGTFDLADIANQTSLAGFDCLETVRGDFDIAAPFSTPNTTLTSISGFSALTSVNGDFSISFNDALTSIPDFPALTSVGGYFRIIGNGDLTSIPDFPALTSVGGGVRIDFNDALTSIPDLSVLTSVGGDFRISHNAALISIPDFSALTSVDESFGISGNDVLTSISDFSALNSVGGYFNISFNDALTSISDFSALNSVGGSFSIIANDALTSISDFSALTSVGGDFRIASNHALTSITDFFSLNSVGGGVRITFNAVLTSIPDFSALNSVDGNFDISSNAALTSIPDFSALTSVGGFFSISYNAALTSIPDFSALNPVGKDFYIYDNDALTSITDFSTLNSVGGVFEIADNDALTNIPDFSGVTVTGTIDCSYGANCPQLQP